MQGRDSALLCILDKGSWNQNFLKVVPPEICKPLTLGGRLPDGHNAKECRHLCTFPGDWFGVIRAARIKALYGCRQRFGRPIAFGYDRISQARSGETSGEPHTHRDRKSTRLN